jgi:hypothetical protein
MKEQLKWTNFVEEKELLSVLSELMSEIPPDISLRVLLTGIEGSGFVF